MQIFSYPLGINEPIILLAQGFANNGFDVDIYIDECSIERSPIDFPEKNINIIRVKLNDTLDINLRLMFHDQLPDLMEFLDVNKAYPRYPLFLKNMIKQAQGIKYDLIIGFERFGIVAAHLLSILKNTPEIYSNLELYEESHCKCQEDRILKRLEVYASRSCCLVIVPDRRRGEILIKDNKIQESSVRPFPVSTKGGQIKEKHDYFRRKFDISIEKKILVYAGNFADWALCMEIVQASNSWSEQYVLIMHTWQKDIQESEYYNDLRREAGSNVFFSIDPIDRDIFPMALSSADAGLMFYTQSDENNSETGSASNKITQYFKAGIPVIASDATSTREIFEHYRCGICVSSPFEIKESLDSFFDNLDTYKHGVFNVFNEHYNFDIHFPPLLEEINSLVS